MEQLHRTTSNYYKGNLTTHTRQGRRMRQDRRRMLTITTQIRLADFQGRTMHTHSNKCRTPSNSSSYISRVWGMFNSPQGIFMVVVIKFYRMHLTRRMHFITEQNNK